MHPFFLSFSIHFFFFLLLLPGFDFVEDDYNAEDCDGHGTHVAGSAIGLQVPGAE